MYIYILIAVSVEFDILIKGIKREIVLVRVIKIRTNMYSYIKYEFYVNHAVYYNIGVLFKFKHLR